MTQNGREEWELALGHSRYLEFLPPVYTGLPFLGRFLLGLEWVLAPLEQTVDNFDLYLDPRTTPSFFLAELAAWLGLVFDDTWPIEKRRLLLVEAVELYGQRGTRRGLRRFIEIYSGAAPHIFDDLDDQPHCFNVVLYLPPDREVQQRTLERIIEANKPAHTTYTLRIFTIKPGNMAGDQTSDIHKETTNG